MGGHFEEGEEEEEDRVAESPTLFSCRIDNAKVGRDERERHPSLPLLPSVVATHGLPSVSMRACLCAGGDGDAGVPEHGREEGPAGAGGGERGRCVHACALCVCVAPCI